jgi:hydroxymethylglutaryl-CoA lyase
VTGEPAPGGVTIVEVSPRDGLQNDPGELSTGQKIELAVRAYQAGLRRIEVTSFVSPRVVPKLSDAESVVAGLKDKNLAGLSMIGLVVNERGVHRAAAAGVDEINVVIVTSEPFSQRNQGMSVGQAMDQLPDLLAAARAAGLRTTVTVGTAFGCPFTGEIDPALVTDMVAGVAAAAPDEIALADTIGVAGPTDVTELFGAIRAVIPAATGLRAHFHDTRRTGMANAAAAVAAGVTSLDASLGGIGGCPFAPRATGNIATEDLVYLLGRMKLQTGVSLARLITGAEWLGESLEHEVPGMLSRAGAFPPGPAPEPAG